MEWTNARPVHGYQMGVLKGVFKMRRASHLVWAVIVLGITFPAVQAVPAVPTNVEAHASLPGQPLAITLAWDLVPGATSYKVYRGTASNAEGSSAIATVTSADYTDTNVVSGPPPKYYYKVAASDSTGTSAQSAETVTPVPQPTSRGSGLVAGTTAGVYYCADALIAGFDWFERLNGWFPSVIGTSHSVNPAGKVIDMAYATEGTMTFKN